jgi:hypothetical protein
MNYLKTYLPYLFGNKIGQKALLPQEISWGSLSFEETLMFHTLKNSLNHYLQELNLNELSEEKVFHLINFFNFFAPEFKKTFLQKFDQEFELFQKSLIADPLSVHDLQTLLNFKNNQLSLFAILPSNRKNLGKLLIRKDNGDFLKDLNGNIWSISILACSGRGLAFHHSNGQTPNGVYSIDGVMPEANKNYEFGKFRRLIVNFTHEENLLPESQKNKNCWLQAVVAQKLGRSLLRIHGTGRVNRNPFTTFYPFVPTSGCIATNENNNDQRELLDMMMVALGLAITFENEVNLKAILYVVEYNDSFEKLIF